MTSAIPPKRSNPVGYRFHPTDQELVGHFLNRKILYPDDQKMPITELKVCDFEPWDLSDKSMIKSNDQVFYFFCPRDYKYAHSRRSNRTTNAGYWKPTGKPRKVKGIGSKKPIGSKRTLVFYKKEHPKPVRTRWIMHEYEYMPQGNFLLCKLKNKSKEHINICETEHLASASESVLTVNSSRGECAPPDHIGSNIEDHNLDEMTAGEQNCPMSLDFGCLNQSELTANSVCDERELGYHLVSEPEDQTPTVTAGEQNCPVSLDFGSLNQSEVMDNSACDENELGYHLASETEDQNPNEMTATSTYEKCQLICQVTSDVEINSDNASDILLSEQDEWSPQATTPDCGNHDAHNKTDMSTMLSASGLEINAAESTYLEGPPTFFDELEALFGPKDCLNSALLYLG